MASRIRSLPAVLVLAALAAACGAPPSEGPPAGGSEPETASTTGDATGTAAPATVEPAELGALEEPSGDVEVGSPAPDFALAPSDGEGVFRLSENAGDPVAIVFFRGTW